MKLLIKQRVFSWRSQFDIYDEAGRPVFLCKGQVFSWGHKLTVYDSRGLEIVYIKQQVMRLRPHYEIHINGKNVTTLIKKFTFMNQRYHYKDMDWEINGNFMAHNYQITCRGIVVLDIKKRWLTWGDTYELTLNDNYNTMLALASAIIIDCIDHAA